MSDGAPGRGERAIADLGAGWRRVAERVGAISLLALAASKSAVRHGAGGHEALRQLYLLGVRSLGLAILVGTFTGMVFSLQFIEALQRFGAAGTVGRVTSLAIFRELGPVLVSLMVGGRIGAGIAAELGSMAVAEQIDALRALGADPVQKLVVPRIAASLLLFPLLTSIANVVALLGASGIAWLEHDLSFLYFYQSVIETNRVGDVVGGLFKTFVFGFLIALVSCFQGLNTRGGTEGVGRATTETVMYVAISVLTADFLLTKLMLSLPV